MPWSWVRVSTATSPLLRDCLGDDKTAGKFADCVASIVAARNGTVDDVKFEPNGKRARVLFRWEETEDWLDILFVLQADDVHDVLSAEEIDERRFRGD